MSLNWWKDKYSDVICFLKKNFWAILLSSLFIFTVIWTGSIISVITSRQILEPLSIKIDGLAESELSSIKVLATLSRAGNTIHLTAVPGYSNEWDNPAQTFVQKIILGFKQEHLNKISQVIVRLGGDNFVFTREQFLAEWKKINTEDADLSLKSNLYDKNGNFDYLIYQAPDKVKAKPLNVPVGSRIFASINFGGSAKLIQKPIISSLKPFCLVEIIILISFLLLIFFHRKSSETAENNNDTLLSKKKFVIFGLSITATFLLLFLINIFILNFYKPDLSQILENASKIYRSAILASVLPEPVERMQFMLSVLLSPLLLLISYRLISKQILKTGENIVNRLYYILSIVFPLALFAVAYIGLAVSNFLYVKNSYFFDDVGKYLYGLLLFPCGAYFILSLKMEKNKIVKVLIYLLSGLLIAAIFFLHIFSLHSDMLVNNAFVAGHFNPVFYSTAQIMAGKTILVDLVSVYGLFPAFLGGIFKLIGFSVLSFTTLMSLLVSFSYLFIFIFLRRLIKSNIILFLGFLTVTFYFLVPNLTPYFQYWPVRIFFPCLVLLLVSFYAQHKNRFLYYLTFVTSATAVLWNLDSGFIVFFSWIIALCGCEIFNVEKNKIIRNIFFHLVTGLLTLGLVFSAYAAYAFLRSGLLPDFSLLWQYQNLFTSGLMMVPMTFPHIWVLLAVIFLAGLLIPIRGWKNQDNNYKHFSIFFLSIMGIGLFSYYEGRSLDVVLYGPLYVVLILLAIIADVVFTDGITNRKMYGSNLLFLIILFFIFSAPINMIYNGGQYYKLIKSGLSSFFDNSGTILTRNADFVRRHTERGENIIILAEMYEGLYYGESGTRSVLNLPSSSDIVFKREVDYVADFLKCNTTYKLFVYPFSKYYFYDEKINDIIRNNYVVVEKSSDDMVLLKKEGNTPNNCSGL